MSRFVPFLVLSSALVGCLGSYGDSGGPGGGGPGPTPGEDAQVYFAREIAPTMQTRCGTCHMTNPNPADPDFMGTSVSTFYTTIETYTSPTACIDGPCMIAFPPDSSILLTKGVHSGGAIGWWVGTEQDKVLEWLRLEVEQRGIEGPQDPCMDNPALPECVNGTSTRPRTVQQALERFAACMDYDEWLLGPGNDDAEERYAESIAWAATTEGLCNGCHNVASDQGFCPGGSCLFTDSWMTFDSHRRSPSILKLVLPVTGAEGVDLVAADRYIEKGYEGGGTDHPSFELRATCTNAIQAYVGAMLAKYHSYGTPCTPAEQPLPPP